MDLQQEWNSLSAELDNSADTVIADQKMLQQESKGLYETLLKHLKYKLRWCLGITLMLLIAAVFTRGGLQYLLIGAFVAYAGGALSMVLKIRQMPLQINYAAVTKPILTERVSLIRGILQMERIWGYIFIPMAPLAGFLAVNLFRNNDLNLVFTHISWMYALPVYVLLSLCGIWLSDRMNRTAFGGYLKKLDSHIAALNEGA